MQSRFENDMGVFKEGNIPAVVVKWYTRYFEGVVGISPCEFDSHLPHEKKLRNAPELFFVIAVSRLLFHEFDSAVLGAPLVSSIVGDWLMGSFADRGQAILRDALSHESGHDGLRPFLRERIVD